MQTLKNIISGAALVSAFVLSAQVYATPVEYRMVSAEADSYSLFPGGHSLWLPGDGTNYDFVESGEFILEKDVPDGEGWATLIGDTWHNGDTDSANARGWRVDFHYSGGTSVGVGKRELIDDAYVENGGPIDTSEWYYLPVLEGVLTGLGTNEGRTMTVVARGPAFQYGDGASGKNIHLGASGWLTACEVVDNQEVCYHGDINVPEPTSLALLSLGLLGFGAASRARKQ